MLHTGFWLADGPVVQRELALNVVILMRREKQLIPDESLGAWMTAFWTVFLDEWDRLDRYRTAKFLQLANGFLIETLDILIKSRWDEDLTRTVTDVWIKTGPFKCISSSLMKSAPGVTFAVTEKFPELFKMVAGDEKLSAEETRAFLRPFFEFVSSFKVVHAAQARVHQRIFRDMADHFDVKVVAEKMFFLAAIQRPEAPARELMYVTVAAYDELMAAAGVEADYDTVYVEAEKEIERRNAVLAKKTAGKKKVPVKPKATRVKKKLKKSRKK